MMSRKNVFLAIALSFVCLAFAAVVVFTWSVFKHPGAVSDTAAVLIGNLTMWMGVAVVFVAAFVQGRRRPSRLPRIENLRIAGKYSGKAAAMGTSPLDLRF
jgi:hypothetical protein